MRGAEVVGIEGREANIAKASFAKEVLSLDRVQFMLTYVCTLEPEQVGTFEVVLCLGLLYNLEAADVAGADNRARVCTGLAMFDTQVAHSPEEPRAHGGRTYCGHSWREHEAGSSRDERLAALWKSLDNETSSYFTQSSLINMLMDAGLTSVYECFVPPEPARRSRTGRPSSR